jgi:hypothetical protein
MEAYELLIPEQTGKTVFPKKENMNIRRTADIIKAKKNLLKKTLSETMDDLILEIVRLNEQTGSKPEN